MATLSSVSSASSSDDDTKKIPTKKMKISRFSEAQRACLNAYYSRGMTGTGERHKSAIERASKDTHLTPAQVKVLAIVTVHVVSL